MKIGAFSVATLMVTGAIALLGAGSVRAQSTEVDPLEDFRTTDGSTNPFEASDSGGAQSSIYQLIHQMQLRNGTTMEDFSRQRRDNILTEAETFRLMQRERLQQNGAVEVVPTDDEPLD